jgi:hypothetical protein
MLEGLFYRPVANILRWDRGTVKDNNVRSFTEHLREELMINFGLHSAGNTGEISDSIAIDHELSARMLTPREPGLK